MRTLVAAIVVLLVALAVLSSAAAGAVAGEADAYQQDAAHDGFIADAGLSAPLTQDWSVTLPSAISYPLIVNGLVYVTTADNTLYALDQATGATVWSHGVGGAPPGLAYDGGQVYVVDSSGLLTAFDAATGSIGWSMQLPGQWSFSSAPTAANGIVYTGGAGSGGTVYAVRESDGHLLWTAGVANGDDSSPAVDATGVYVSYACQQAYDFDPTAGTLIWHHDSACEGGGGDTPVLADGNLFARDGPLGNIVLSASTGAELGPFNAGPPPAVGNGVAYMLSGSTTPTLTAVKNAGLGVNAWQFTGDGHLESAPLVVGNLVFEGSSQGELYALDAATGATSWSTNVGGAIAAPGGLLTGLAAANGTLIVPAGDKLIAFSTADTAGVPVNVTPPTLTGTAQMGETVTVSQGTWTGNPSSFKYQWYSCDAALANCNAIPAATQNSYKVGSGDVGRKLVAGVVAHNLTGDSAEKRSNATDAVLPEVSSVEVGPTISGPAQVGGLLTADPGIWSNSPSSYLYQWKECSSALTDCASLGPGAESATYAPADSDLGKRLVVEVVAVNVGGHSAPADSGATAAVTVPKASAPKCHVPKVVGLKLAAAKTWIRSANCSVGRITAKASTPRKRGRVLSESPKPGRTMVRGAKVNLEVGRRA